MVLFYSLVKPCRSLALLLLFSTLSPSAFAAESQPEYGAGEVPNQVDLEEQDRAENPGSEDKNATRKAVEAKAPKLLLLPIFSKVKSHLH